MITVSDIRDYSSKLFERLIIKISLWITVKHRLDSK